MHLDSGYFSGIATAGSADAFALLFCPQAERENFRILLAFEKLVNELSLGKLEPDVRQVKLGWWANELTRMTSGEAVHPVTVAVNEILSSKRLSPAPLLAFFSAVADEASDALPTTPDELLNHAGHRGAVLLLFAQVLMPGKTMSDGGSDACREIGAARFLATIFGADHGSHRKANPMRTPEPQVLETQLIGIQLERMQTALQAMPAEERSRLVPILVMAGQLNEQLLGIHAGSHRQRPPQLRSLLRAWRSARRAVAGKLPVLALPTQRKHKP